MKIIPKNSQETSRWSGGSTRQVWIYPETAVYAQRNFDIRISSAVVETEQSVFTALPGYHRVLMVLEGALRIEHEGQHTARLGKFDTDVFSGSWNTTGYGRATDFNVMTSAAYTATVDNSPAIPAAGALAWLCFYLHRGEAVFIQEGTTHVLQAGDALLLNAGEMAAGSFAWTNTSRAELVRVCIRLR